MTAKHYTYGDEFQLKILGCILKDASFNGRTGGLVKPDYFADTAHSVVCDLALKYYAKYNKGPDAKTFALLLDRAQAKKHFRADIREDVDAAVVAAFEADISDVDFICDEISDFARHRAVESALLDCVPLLEVGDIDKARKIFNEACEVGMTDKLQRYDYAARLQERSTAREEELTGKRKPCGIPSGVDVLDQNLKHRGFGRGELTVFMGGPKSGKSTGLAFFARNAAVLSYNVLIVTLEVSTDITTDRIDASLSEIAVDLLKDRYQDVEDRVRARLTTAGKLYIEEFPTGTLTPSMLNRIIQRYKSDGITFDEVIVDYADIMAPDYRYDSPIENSKSIYIGLRALAKIENFACLTATQTNREGAKATTAKMTDVSEDLNRVRIADLVISINATDDERDRNEARLFFAASRNQKGNFSIRVQRDLETMRFITKVLGVE